MKNLFALLFAIIAITSYGQNNYQDVVYLKNGGIIRGIIIEQVPNKSIKIETADRNVFVYQMDEIDKLTKEPIYGKSISSISNPGIGMAEFGYQIGTGDYGMDRFKLNIINIYQLNPYFLIGFGTGLRYYFDAEAALIPVFADVIANFVDDNITPYLSLGIGYSFDATNNFKGVGFLVNPTLGISSKISEKYAMNVGIGYEIQRMKFFYYDYVNYYEFYENSGAISISVGISF